MQFYVRILLSSSRQAMKSIQISRPISFQAKRVVYSWRTSLSKILSRSRQGAVQVQHRCGFVFAERRKRICPFKMAKYFVRCRFLRLRIHPNHQSRLLMYHSHFQSQFFAHPRIHQSHFLTQRNRLLFVIISVLVLILKKILLF